MLSIVVASVLLAFGILQGCEAAAPVLGYTVLETYPHSTSSFCQGLLIDSSTGFMFESTGLYGSSRLLRLNHTSYTILQEYSLPSNVFGEGLALFQGSLYQLTWKARLVYRYNKDTFPNGPVETLQNPVQQGWGLTHDGTSLILSDGSSSLYFLNPSTLAIQRTITVKDGSTTIQNLNELEYINGEIWANIWYQNKVVRVNPLNGVVNSVVDFTGLKTTGDVLNGIAYDPSNGRIIVTGKNWPNTYLVSVENPAASTTQTPSTYAGEETTADSVTQLTTSLTPSPSSSSSSSPSNADSTADTESTAKTAACYPLNSSMWMILLGIFIIIQQ